MTANSNFLERLTATGKRHFKRVGIGSKAPRKVWILGSTGMLVIAMTLGSSFRHADAHSESSRWDCSNRTLKGTYGGQVQGTRPIPGGTGTESFIGVVIRTYDGMGNFTQFDNVKGATSGFVPDRPGSGTYHVNADCTGMTLFQPGPGVVIEERTVIVDYGNEVRSITVRPQALMATAAAKRIGFR